MNNTLLRRTRLRNGESLPSLLVRLEQRNYYQQQSILPRLCLSEGDTDRLSCPSNATTYHRMAQLTALPAVSLHAATIHTFATIVTPPDSQVAHLSFATGEVVPLLSQGRATKHMRPDTRAAFCPMCLREGPYHRLIWFPLAVSACTRHACLLVERCHQCDETVSVRAITLNRCRTCGASLSQAPSLSVAADEWGLFAQELIQAWHCGRHAQACQQEHGLPKQPARILMRVVEGVKSALCHTAGDWHVPHSLDANSAHPLPPITGKPTVEQSYRLYATAVRALTQWPHEFIRFLDEYQRYQTARGKRGLYAGLGTLRQRWLDKNWSSPDFVFVQEAYRQYLLASSPEITALAVFQSDVYRDGDTLSDDLEYMSCAEAMRTLGISEDTIDALADLDQLTVKAVQVTPHRRVQLVRRADVEAVRRRWERSLSLPEAAKRVGTSKSILLKLVGRHLIEADRGPDVDGSTAWRINGESLDTCIQRVRSRVTFVSNPSQQWVALVTAARKMSVIGVDTGGILQLVLEEKLRAYHDAAALFQLNGLLFSVEDIAATIEGIKAEHGLCTRVEAARRLGVKHTTLKKWCDAGLLRMVPHGTTTYVTEDELRCFEDRYVFAEDAAQCLGIAVHTLYQWVRNGRLDAVQGNGSTDWHRLLFRRDEIAGLQPRSAVSGPELARRLGVSRATIYRWTQEGRLQPVSGPGVDDTGRYLYDVTDLPDEIASE